MNERILALRQKMTEKNIDLYIVPTNDYHSSEYIGDFFKSREYICGFTGSAGTAVITMTEAGLWTDGRYFIQAQRELFDDFTLYKQGCDGVPSIPEYIKSFVESKKDSNKVVTIGFDGKCIDCGYIKMLNNQLKPYEVIFNGKIDIVGMIWTDRPTIDFRDVYELDVKYTGETRRSKLDKIRKTLLDSESDCLILTSLDDIAWLMNLRGDDVKCNPVFMSYVILKKDVTYLYANKKSFNGDLINKLKEDNVIVRDYEIFYQDLQLIESTERILLDVNLINYEISHILSGHQCVDSINPTLLLKAIKNEIEIENEKKAHIKDGVALTKFIYYIKNNIGREFITECSAVKYLEDLRKNGEGYIGPSFESIVAYKENAAMCHYSPSVEEDRQIKPEGFLLFDTGGHYFEGTTDVTRTITLGKISDEEKLHYTLVLMGNLKLMDAKFIYGVKGQNLDYIAREALWRHGLDYNHGTGHGVGYMLNVHEGPNNIRWRITNSKCPDNEILREGMITSDEPGLYLEGRYGIRLENLLVCKKDIENEYGQFMKFEVLTLAPFDLEAVDVNVMDGHSRELLNEYHELVYNKIAMHLNDEERAWLKEATRRI